jgi:hypothetical protein
MKHYFVLVPLIVEAGLFLSRLWLFKEKPRFILAPETVALGATGAVILALLIIFFPVYFKDILPMAMALYGGYDNSGLTYKILKPMAVPIVTAVFFMNLRKSSAWFRGVMLSFSFAGLAGLLIFILQNKGWSYHILIALYAITALAIFALAAPKEFLSGVKFGKRAGMIAGLIFLAQLVWLHQFYVLHINLNPEAVRRVITAAPPGPFYIMSTEVYPAFPMALELRNEHPWASRFGNLLMLPGIIAAERRGAASPYAEPLRRMVAEDLNRYKPVIALTPQPGCPAWPMPADFLFIDWFKQSADFRAAWAHYRRQGTVNCFEIYYRRKK